MFQLREETERNLVSGLGLSSGIATSGKLLYSHGPVSSWMKQGENWALREDIGYSKHRQSFLFVGLFQ